MSFLKNAKESLANQSKYAHLNAFISRPESHLVRSQVDAAAKAPQSQHAVPFGELIAVKDNICTADLPTTAASGILRNFTSPYDATVVKQLRDAGAIMAGKTNMDEFGMGSHSTHSYFGSVSFGHSDGAPLSAGGSSGGSAVAVASNQSKAALGTDTGGSIRLPAAYTGIVGFKPSYGLLSRWGVIAYANSLDTVGIMAKEVQFARKMFHVMNQFDSKDPTSLSSTTRSKLGSSGRNSQSLRIGIPTDYNISTLSPIVRNAWIHSLRLLEKEGHTLHTVSLPTTRHALSAYYVLAPAEASSNLAKYDGVRYGSRADGIDGTPESVLFAKTRGQGFGAEVQRRIVLGAFSLSAQAIDNYFIQAQKIRRLVQQEFDSVFLTPNPLVTSQESSNEGIDVLVCPTAPTPAPQLSWLKDQSPLDAYMNDVFTVPASLAGLPAINVPVPVSLQDGDANLDSETEEQKIGIQIIGQYGDDELVLDVAQELEKVS